VGIAPSTYYAVKAREASPSVRAVRDEELVAKIREVHEKNLGVYGVRKVWWQLAREDVNVARCTVERLMAREGLKDAIRGKKRRTTIPGGQSERAPDLVDRNFKASARGESVQVGAPSARRGGGMRVVRRIGNVEMATISDFEVATRRQALALAADVEVTNGQEILEEAASRLPRPRPNSSACEGRRKHPAAAHPQALPPRSCSGGSVHASGARIAWTPGRGHTLRAHGRFAVLESG
jgi:hypothetical protein